VAARIERSETRKQLLLVGYSTRGATVPWVLFTLDVVAVARVRGGRPWASPQPGKKEGFSFLILA